MTTKVTGGTIERGEPWTSHGDDAPKYKCISWNRHTNETEVFWTESAARHALHVVDETIVSERYRNSET